MSTTLTWYGAFLVALSLERLFEVWLSNRNAARAFARGGVEVGAPHFRVMATLHTLFPFVCMAEAWGLQRTFDPLLGTAALGVAVGCQGLRYWAIATLGDRWNTRIIFIPDAAPVTGGPYRWIRHPNYVAVITELAVVPLIHSAYWTSLVFTIANAWLLTVRIRTEEASLGARYAEAFAKRPRFIPGGER